MNAQNSEDFDALEEALDENNIPMEDLLSTYRDFLEELANNGRFTTIPKKASHIFVIALKNRYGC